MVGINETVHVCESCLVLHAHDDDLCYSCTRMFEEINRPPAPLETYEKVVVGIFIAIVAAAIPFLGYAIAGLFGFLK